MCSDAFNVENVIKHSLLVLGTVRLKKQSVTHIGRRGLHLSSTYQRRVFSASDCFSIIHCSAATAVQRALWSVNVVHNFPSSCPIKFDSVISIFFTQQHVALFSLHFSYFPPVCYTNVPHRQRILYVLHDVSACQTLSLPPYLGFLSVSSYCTSDTFLLLLCFPPLTM